MKDILSPEIPGTKKPGRTASENSRRMPLKRQDWSYIRKTVEPGDGSRFVLDLRPHV